MPPSYGSESSDWLRPQAGYPAQPGPYGSPQPQVPGYAYPPAAVPQPQPPYAYPPANPYASYPAPMPQPVNVVINNAQNNIPQMGYLGPYVYDPYAGSAGTTLALGIWAILVWIIPVLGTLASLICAVIGLFVAIRGCKSTTRRGSAITGLVLCIITLTLFTFGILMFGATLLALMSGHHSTTYP
jgi:hypothetical protein